MPGYATSRDFEAADAASRANQWLLRCMASWRTAACYRRQNRETASPVAAGNIDAVGPADRALARALIDPFPAHVRGEPLSSLGPGFARSVKPDVLMPGARNNDLCRRSQPHRRSSGRGLARRWSQGRGPTTSGRENLDGYSNGTSAAAALASRTCHRIHDALETAYGEAFLRIPPVQRAVLLKALLVHPAQWPQETFMPNSSSPHLGLLVAAKRQEAEGQYTALPRLRLCRC